MTRLSLFGFLTGGDPEFVTIAFVIIVTYLASADYALHQIEIWLKNSAYESVLQSLYKEIMIMGISGFGITMLLAVNFVEGNSSHTWITYLEIAETTLFFATVIHAILSILMIVHNVRYIKTYREYLALDVHDLVKILDERLQDWNPFNPAVRQAELKIFRILFLKQFNLTRNFDFARYITLSEEENILRMLEISPMQWALFLFFVALHYICLKFIVTWDDLFGSIAKSHCPEDDKECLLAMPQLLLYLVLLGLFVSFSVILAVMSRIYLLRLLRKDGPKNKSEYSKFIMDDELEHLVEEEEGEKARMSFKELKSTIANMKRSQENAKLHPLETHKHSSVVSDEPDVSNGKKLWRKTAVIVKLIFPDAANAAVSPEEAEASVSSSQHGNASPEKPRGTIIDQSSFDLGEKLSRTKQSMFASTIMFPKLKLLLSAEDGTNGIFFLNSSKLYFSARNSSYSFLHLFLAFYVVDMVEISMHVHYPYFAWWHATVFAMFLIAFAALFYTIRSSGQIFSLTRFDRDVVSKVIEEQDELKEMEDTVREKLLTKLKNTFDGEEDSEAALIQLFNEIQCLDGEEDGMISPYELRQLLKRLNLHYTSKRIDDLFQLFDHDCDGGISLIEFHAFIFPKAAAALKHNKRVKKFEERIVQQDHENYSTLSAVPEVANNALSSAPSEQGVDIFAVTKHRRTAVTFRRKVSEAAEKKGSLYSGESKSGISLMNRLQSNRSKYNSSAAMDTETSSGNGGALSGSLTGHSLPRHDSNYEGETAKTLDDEELLMMD